jgi:hypothetical protein
MGSGARAPVGRETPRLLQSGSGGAEPDGMASEAKDTLRPALGGEHVEALGGDTMTIAADQPMGLGPVGPQRRHQADHNQGLFGAGRAGARPQGGRDESLRRPCKNAERQRTLVLRGRK